MGKWSQAYYDDVLNAKIKSLVSGAITRSKLDNVDPTITYESFVEDLDAGDSFTTSVVDILVKELAERRTRNTVDRRLIADRTAKNLRVLATSSRIYRGRRRSNLFPDHVISAPADMGVVDDDDEEFDGLIAPHVEGARGSDMYEAYGTSWSSAIFNRTLSDDSPSPPPPQLASPPPTSSLTRILVGGPPAPPISRQASLRRAHRSRTGDFSDFAARRRSMFRDAAVTDEPETGVSRIGQRRFFQFPRNHHRFEAATSWLSPWGEDAEEPRAFPVVEPSPSSAAWFYQNGPLTPTLSQDSTDLDHVAPEEVRVVPRLRRGGVRAPESMLSRHASPIPDGRPATVVDEPGISNDERPPATAYPTPGPAEPENP